MNSRWKIWWSQATIEEIYALGLLIFVSGILIGAGVSYCYFLHSFQPVEENLDQLKESLNQQLVTMESYRQQHYKSLEYLNNCESRLNECKSKLNECQR